MVGERNPIRSLGWIRPEKPGLSESEKVALLWYPKDGELLCEGRMIQCRTDRRKVKSPPSDT